MGTRLAFAAFMEQRLADNAAERTQLERVGVVAKRALCRHHARIIGALFFTAIGTFLVLTTMTLAVTGHTPVMLLSDFAAGHNPALLLSAAFTGHTPLPPPLVAPAKGQSELIFIQSVFPSLQKMGQGT